LDLDLLVPNPVAVQRALIAADFEPVREEQHDPSSHQMPALRHREFPLAVEVHIGLHWVEGIPSPPVAELFEAAVESVVPVAGISALPRVHHAVLLAAHAWAHGPLGRLRHLIDVAAVRQGVSASDADALATAWGVDRIWRRTVATIDALLFDTGHSWPLRVWARHLGSVREPTVLETHLSRWLAAFAGLPPRQAASMALRAIGDDFRPIAHEGWATKFGRARTAIRNAFVRRSQHAAQLERTFVDVDSHRIEVSRVEW
jgi:hypothetical protein